MDFPKVTRFPGIRVSVCLRMLGVAGLAGLAVGCSETAAPPEKQNILFIAVDDLRPTLSCYGDPVARTPNFDRLASRGVVFNRAYTQEAVCNPSRASVITGKRPDASQVWDLKEHFRDSDPAVVTLPQFFKNLGYETQSIGKVLHGSGPPAKDPPSWTLPPLYDLTSDKPPLRYSLPENLEGEGMKRAATEAADVPDTDYADGLVCEEALKALATFAEQKKPFFLGVGFRKPHLPFCAPKKYWDMYDIGHIPPPVSTTHPLDAPELAVRSWHELEGYRDIPEDGQLTAEQVQHLRHGYYACVSFIDAQLGRLLDELDRLGLADNTLIALWGDHGFHLGEQGLWTKSNNYELATRVPLIVVAPGQVKGGVKADGFVELVDLYPTLIDLCGLARPEGIDGMSLLPVLNNPEKPFKPGAWSQFPRDETSWRHKSHGDYMGYTVRTDRYRYVEWQRWDSRAVVATELYDHQNDPDEMTNVAARPENAAIVEELAALLREGFKSLNPEYVR